MTPTLFQQPGPVYTNPVYPRSFPVPFVLKYNGEYYAYCTGHWDDGRVFGVLHSADLIDWTPIGGAMAELDPREPFYWAPEVTYWNGTFYLYYSVGNETIMHLRVATSDRPCGGFTDAGIRLTKEEFAIDAHVFIDDDGRRYMFYATDFLEHTHIGTGVVVDSMVDWFTLAGEPHPVVRAKYDWQVYDPARKEKGGVRWHTVEGPFVLKRKGRYFMMYSGGNWQQPTYGVSFAVAGDINSPDEWRQFSDGENVLPILRTDEKHQVGPGHNSVVRGPNNRDLYCVYHYWHDGNRVLALNRMDFTGSRIFVESKPYLPKARPLPPSSDLALLATAWEHTGAWTVNESEVETSGRTLSILRSPQLPPQFLCHVSFCAKSLSKGGEIGFRFEAGTITLGGLTVCVDQGCLAYKWLEEETNRGGPLLLGTEFRPDAYHLISIEADGAQVVVKLDHAYVTVSRLLGRRAEKLALIVDDAEAAFSSFALTAGFEDRFEREVGMAELPFGWSSNSETAELKIVEQELIFSSVDGHDAVIRKGELAENFDFVANLRQKGPLERGGSYGFVLMGDDRKILARFEFREKDGRFCLADNSGASPAELPFDFNSRVLYQFRFRLRAGRLSYDLETIPLGSIVVPAGRALMGIFVCQASVAVEMVRLTIIDS
ncbi:MAG: glycoside hydrolase family 43 protein [Acidobacteria bacterium]|nr:glycoside hydrolase family 43 protein [Acidobacteriota bacterium]